MNCNFKTQPCHMELGNVSFPVIFTPTQTLHEQVARTPHARTGTGPGPTWESRARLAAGGCTGPGWPAFPSSARCPWCSRGTATWWAEARSGTGAGAQGEGYLRDCSGHLSPLPKASATFPHSPPRVTRPQGRCVLAAVSNIQLAFSLRHSPFTGSPERLDA